MFQKNEVEFTFATDFKVISKKMTLKNIVKINSLCYTWYSKGRDKMRKFNTLFVSILVAFIFVVSPCSVNASNDSTNPLQGRYKVKTTNNAAKCISII